ncbi:MAG: methyltransferase [bacterium]
MSWTIEKFMEIATGYWPASVISASVQLGLFDTLEGRGSTAGEAASKLGTAPVHTAELLDALVALDVLEKWTETGRSTVQDPLYRLKPSAAQFLTRSGSCCILDALRYNVDLYPLWGRLAECVKNGKPVIPVGAHLGGDPERTRRFALGMHSRALAMAPILIPALDMKGRSRLLDIACGPGTFSTQLAEKYPCLEVTLFDLAPVLDVARTLVSSRPCASRVMFEPGDYHSAPLPQGFDAVLYSGALHQEDPEFAASLFKKIFETMEPGGRVFVVDMMLQAGRTEPVFSILFSINMMLTSPDGHVYSEDTVRSLLTKAGFEETNCKRLADCPYWIVTADKPPFSRLPPPGRQE